MVYGLNLKPEWGYYPTVEVQDGDTASAKAIITPDGGVGTGGFPKETAGLPKRVIWKDPNGNPVPDFDQTPRLNVSERAKQVIESLEPGVHQFVPVNYFDVRGRFLDNRYWLIVCNRIDSLDREHTTLVPAPGLGWYPVSDLIAVGVPIPLNICLNEPARMVFNIRQIGNVHMWHDKYLGTGEFISDDMAQAFMLGGLTGLHLEDSRVESI